MRVKVQRISAGLHPNERVVEVETPEGAVRLVVDKRAIVNGTVAVGSPITKKGSRWLVELPREAFDGRWRVWVNGNSLVDDTKEARAA